MGEAAVNDWDAFSLEGKRQTNPWLTAGVIAVSGCGRPRLRG